MKNIKFLLLFTTIFSIILSTGCKKNDTAEPGNAKEFQVQTITVPDAMSQSSNQGAQLAAGYIGMANGMAAFGAMMTPPKSAVAIHYKGSGEPEIHQWNVDDGEDNNYTVTLTITETTDLYKWEMKVDGLVEGQQVDNFIFIKAEQYKDGHDNSITVFDPHNPLTISFVMNWHKVNDIFYITFEEPQSIKVGFVIYADGSGSIDAKEWSEEHEDYEQTYTATWDASGHGEYWKYDNGEETDHGTW